MNKEDFFIGMEVRVFGGSRYESSRDGSDGIAAEVTKIGRKNVNIRRLGMGTETAYSMEDQDEVRGINATGYPSRFRTLEQVAASKQRKTDEAKLEEIGIRFHEWKKPTDEQVRIIASAFGITESNDK